MTRHYSSDDTEHDEAKIRDARKTSDLAGLLDRIVRASQAEIAASDVPNTHPDYAPLGYVRKGKRMHKILAVGGGQVIRICGKPCCTKLLRIQRYCLLPCNHHGLITLCNCPVRDRHCRTCRQTFIGVGDTWYRIADPHAQEPT